MNTTIYLMRHSEPMEKPVNLTNTDSLQIWNEKGPLSINGEKKAERISKTAELQNIDYVISSSYVRAMSTAKYIAYENEKQLHINENFGERKFGIDSWSEKPENFEQRQILDENFKTKNGESRKEVTERMYKALMETLNENKGKRIAIVSHGTAITFLLMKYGEMKDNELYVNNKLIFDKDYKYQAPELFKLVFDENNNLIDISNIRDLI